MKLYLGSIGDYEKTSMIVEHTDPTGPLSIDDLNKRKEHNQAMLKGCDIACKMWKALSNIYGGDQNVQRAKRESLRGKFDEIAPRINR